MVDDCTRRLISPGGDRRPDVTRPSLPFPGNGVSIIVDDYADLDGVRSPQLGLALVRGRDRFWHGDFTHRIIVRPETPGNAQTRGAVKAVAGVSRSMSSQSLNGRRALLH